MAEWDWMWTSADYFYVPKRMSESELTHMNKQISKIQLLLTDVNSEILHTSFDDFEFLVRAVDILYSKTKTLHNSLFKKVENEVYNPPK
jgi:hypothetical protein